LIKPVIVLDEGHKAYFQVIFEDEWKRVVNAMAANHD